MQKEVKNKFKEEKIGRPLLRRCPSCKYFKAAVMLAQSGGDASWLVGVVTNVKKK